MKAPLGPARKPKAKGRSRTSKSHKSATKSPPKAKARPGASEAKPIKVRNGEQVAVVLSGGNIAKADGDAQASRLIDQRIRDLGGWRGQTLARMRALILEAVPEVTEEWKWRGTPVWSHHGIVCTGEAYTKVVKLTFARGASIPDPSRLFNSSLEGNTRRAIDIHEGEEVDAGAFEALVKAAVAQNGSPAKQRLKAPAGPVRMPGKAKPKTTSRASKPRKSATKSKAGANGKPGASEAKPIKVRRGEKGVVLLSGGNPQIAKADGDAPVQAYIAGMPGWKRDLGKRLDALIVRNVPDVRKAMKWNSPLYGIEGRGWFLGVHTFTHYVKVAFFRGMSLRPVPPGASKDKDTRYVDLHEDELDEAQMATWVKQAAALPGWVPGRPS